ncbi:MAG: flavin monoamine oxidase family protein [Sphingobacteriaceae bacterium]|nr:flavin monoamine oxidase family protein [Cytophagaceae bacterium]
MTRRDFIEKSGNGYLAMLGLGLLPAAPATAFNLPRTEKANKKVLILGAGLAGMTTAYELGKLGYDCTILEARTRAGGRVWTVRGGTEETEVGGEKQVCRFDEGQYLNAGAARIPHHHQLTLHYCRELKVPVEIFGNFNEAGFYYSDQPTGKLANQRVRAREIHADMRGQLYELLVKADPASLGAEMTAEDVEKLRFWLKEEAGLTTERKYGGSEMRGYKVRPAAGTQSGELSSPYALKDIIESGLTHPAFANVGEYTYHQQPVLLQMVGGNDNLPKAFARVLGDKIRYGCEVKELRKTPGGARVVFLDKKSGTTGEISADFCVCTLPLPMLKQVQSDLSGPVQRVADFLPYMHTTKIGLQFKRRFWEEDDNVFGGITKTNMDITQIFYPSYNFLGQKGVLKGMYNFHDRATKVGNLSLPEREKLALEQGGKIHPQYRAEFENSFSLAWHKIPYSMGGWAEYNKAARDRMYPALLEPDDAIYFAGEHVSYLTAWMAGALESARRTVEVLHKRVAAG